MTITRTILVLAGLLLWVNGPIRAQSTLETQEVLAVVQSTFDAMRDKDGDRLRGLFHPEARLFSTGLREGGPSIAVTTLDDFVESVANSENLLDERFHDPEVRIEENLASVWTPYTFHRGEVFNHCGIDAFHLIRDESGWKIVGLAYTRTRDGCRPGR
jgi:hypothetical protein